MFKSQTIRHKTKSFIRGKGCQFCLEHVLPCRVERRPLRGQTRKQIVKIRSHWCGIWPNGAAITTQVFAASKMNRQLSQFGAVFDEKEEDSYLPPKRHRILAANERETDRRGGSKSALRAAWRRKRGGGGKKGRKEDRACAVEHFARNPNLMACNSALPAPPSYYIQSYQRR